MWSGKCQLQFRVSTLLSFWAWFIKPDPSACCIYYHFTDNNSSLTVIDSLLRTSLGNTSKGIRVMCTVCVSLRTSTHVLLCKLNNKLLIRPNFYGIPNLKLFVGNLFFLLCAVGNFLIFKFSQKHMVVLWEVFNSMKFPTAQIWNCQNTMSHAWYC